MFKVVGESVFERVRVPDTYTVRRWDLGGGHVEVLVQPVYAWRETDDCPVRTVAGLAEDRKPEADREVENAERAARRAKTKVRRLCKVLFLDTLLTLTYRANQTSLELCKRHFALFLKRVNRVLEPLGGRLPYVACFERQARGAWHVHIATRRIASSLTHGGVVVKSYDLIRSLWRATTGELGGNIDVSRRKRSSSRSSARLASYLSKYILKDCNELDVGTRRFQASAADVPVPSCVVVVGENLRELVGRCFVGVEGLAVVCAWLPSVGDCFFGAFERGKYPPGYPGAPCSEPE